MSTACYVYSGCLHEFARHASRLTALWHCRAGALFVHRHVARMVSTPRPRLRATWWGTGSPAYERHEAERGELPPWIDAVVRARWVTWRPKGNAH